MASKSASGTTNFSKRRKIDAEKAPEKIADLLASVLGLLEARQVSERKRVEIDKIQQDIIKYAEKLEKIEKYGQSATFLAQVYNDLIHEAMKTLKLQNEAHNEATMLRIKLIRKMGKELEKETIDEKAVEHWKERIEFISRQLNERYMLDPIKSMFNEIKYEFNLIKEYLTVSGTLKILFTRLDTNNRKGQTQFRQRFLERDCIDVEGHLSI